MKIKIRRYYPHFDPPSITMEYEIPKGSTLLEGLEYIKKSKDRTLTYSFMCRSGVCGSCAVRVNGKEELACEYRPQDGDLVEPLSVLHCIRDLVVDFAPSLQTLHRAKSYPIKMHPGMSEEQERLIERQSDCILCHSCYSSCPVYETNGSFLGPFALSRSYRYLVDAREEEKKEHIDAIVKDGIWDWDMVTNTVYYSPRWKEMLGYKDDEIVNEFKSWENLSHPLELKDSMVELTNYINGKIDVYENRHRLKHKNGSWIWILSRGKLNYDSDGNPIRMVGTHTDVTREMKLQENWP